MRCRARLHRIEPVLRKQYALKRRFYAHVRHSRDLHLPRDFRVAHAVQTEVAYEPVQVRAVGFPFPAGEVDGARRPEERRGALLVQKIAPRADGVLFERLVVEERVGAVQSERERAARAHRFGKAFPERGCDVLSEFSVCVSCRHMISFPLCTNLL